MRRAVVFTLLFGISSFARAQQVQASRQALLVLKTLAYDDTLAKRADGQVEILVVHPPAGKSFAEEVAKAFRLAATKVTVGGLPVVVTTHVFSGGAGLKAMLASESPTAIYVCEGATQHVANISALTRQHSVLSFSGSEKCVRAGLGVGIVRRGDRAALLINLPATRAEGSRLRPELLALAELIR